MNKFASIVLAGVTAMAPGFAASALAWEMAMAIQERRA